MMKAEELKRVLELYPKADIYVWGDRDANIEITYGKDNVIINIKKDRLSVQPETVKGNYID